jgi:hypothetical protein
VEALVAETANGCLVLHRAGTIAERQKPRVEELEKTFHALLQSASGELFSLDKDLSWKSRWYQAAIRQKAGRITAAGMTKEVSFEPVDGAINKLIDDAYRAKYKGSPYLNPMIGTRARSATVKVLPRNAE